ncbi:MAG TPA: aminotransferase class V-fold PLP-dependent enzyme, partial [Tepidisphaeraceae bacterium]|nr:aminotransferase class V-fold PLP-dependent enzyme [Tepidisphaeraceae bacterium]
GFGQGVYLGKNWFEAIDKSRAALARLINADVCEISLQKNTGDAISFVAGGLDWKAGDRIVSANVEYPSNIFPWKNVAEKFGAHVELVKERLDPDGAVRVHEDDLINACDSRTRVLAISHVEWGSGQRMNLEKLGSFCRERGILFCVDVIQSIGVVPIDVKKIPVDCLCTGGHKWLMSPPGSGMLYVRKEWIEKLRPVMVGWASVENPMTWSTNFVLSKTAERFETGVMSVASFVGLESSVNALHEIGIEKIHARVRSLCDRFAELMRRSDLKVRTPLESAAGAISFEVPGDPEALVKKLASDFNTHMAARHERARFSPHFYNTETQVDRVAETVLQALRA